MGARAQPAASRTDSGKVLEWESVKLRLLQLLLEASAGNWFLPAVGLVSPDDEGSSAAHPWYQELYAPAAPGRREAGGERCGAFSCRCKAQRACVRV